MSKRSSFERIPRDFYRTPEPAVPPLLPFLRGVRTFAEPCCGDGALVRHLESFGLRSAYRGVGAPVPLQSPPSPDGASQTARLEPSGQCFRDPAKLLPQ